jgi:hypothetical protein
VCVTVCVCVCVCVWIQVDYFKRITLRDEIFRPLQVCARTHARAVLFDCSFVCVRVSVCVSLSMYT